MMELVPNEIVWALVFFLWATAIWVLYLIWLLGEKLNRMQVRVLSGALLNFTLDKCTHCNIELYSAKQPSILSHQGLNERIWKVGPVLLKAKAPFLFQTTSPTHILAVLQEAQK
jgi:hypothetical protein